MVCFQIRSLPRFLSLIINHLPSTEIMMDQTQSHNWYFMKLLVLTFCLSCDLVLSSISELLTEADKNKSRIHCQLSVLVILSSFTMIFSLVCSTFPFRIGLVGEVVKHFSVMLAVTLLYLSLTLVVGSMRITMINSGSTIVEIWESGSYTCFSFLRSLGEPCLRNAFFHLYSALRFPFFETHRIVASIPNLLRIHHQMRGRTRPSKVLHKDRMERLAAPLELYRNTV